MSLAQRALAERLFFNTCREIRRACQRTGFFHEDLEILETILADTYFCNFSVFQSMPDSWAVDQLFPIMPLHRHDERPERKATLADMTCDSDGKIDRFIDPRDVKPYLELHPPNGQDYYLGAFLVGAYQEILGDLTTCSAIPRRPRFAQRGQCPGARNHVRRHSARSCKVIEPDS